MENWEEKQNENKNDEGYHEPSSISFAPEESNQILEHKKQNNFFQKTKVFFKDLFFFLFKSAAENHLRIQSLKNKETEITSLKFNSYIQLKRYQKRLRAFTFSGSSMLAAVLVAAMVLQLFPSGSRGATFGWTQETWNNLDTSTQTGTATHNVDNNNTWTKYSAKDLNIDLTNNRIQLSATNGSITQTDDGTGFSSGTNSSTASNGTGITLAPTESVPVTNTYTHETTNIAYSGSITTYNVPNNTYGLLITANGAGGGNGLGAGTGGVGGAGAAGGLSKGTMSVTPGKTYYALVGGKGNNAVQYVGAAGGFGGGGTTPGRTSPGGGGGGMTAMWLSNYATSETSYDMATVASKQFTVQAGLSTFSTSAGAYGNIVMFVNRNDLTKWMVGKVTGYSGTTLTVTITYIYGSGIFSTWDIGPVAFVAGGGGGGGGTYQGTGGAGGAGGGSSGSNGSVTCSAAGGGGSQTSGGTAGGGGASRAGVAGAGAGVIANYADDNGGAGGGGYYGGGSGNGSQTVGCGGGGGGGGSAFTGGLTEASTTAGLGAAARTDGSLSIVPVVRSWTVPAGVTSATFTANGAGGGAGYYTGQSSAPGSIGGKSEGMLSGENLSGTYYISVGGAGGSGSSSAPGGYGGGGAGGGISGYFGGGGGGMTWISKSSTYPASYSDSNLIMVAGGGGGGAGRNTLGTGGTGGGINGVDGGPSGGSYGRKGTSSAGGATGGAGEGTAATAGSLGNGGQGAVSAGGGGGGYYGGGGGAGTSGSYGGGGGGSGYQKNTLTSTSWGTNAAGAGQPGSATIAYNTPITYDTATGTYTSNIINTGHGNVSWGNLAWDSVLDGQTITMNVRTCDDSQCLGEPDISTCGDITVTDGSNSSSPTSLAGRSCINVTDQYVQYKATLVSTDADKLKTPTLNDVTIGYSFYANAVQTNTQTSDADFGSSGSAFSSTVGSSNSVKLTSTGGNNITVPFSTSGQQTWTVPAGVTSLTVDMAGAQGGNGGITAGGKGARVQTTLSVTPSSTLNVYVGGAGANATTAGYNGGGAGGVFVNVGYGGGGGGASDIRIGGTALANRTVVAGGGGGTGGGGGAGGASGQTGSNGTAGTSSVYGGGATQSAGGAAGLAGSVGSGSGAAGDLGIGGAGGGGYYGGGGGGGGGYYGGGGGSGGNTGGNGGGGGGGSSYSSGTGTTYTSGYQSSTGYVNISYINPVVYSSPGIYTSAPINIDSNFFWGNLSWTETKATGQNITMKARSCANPDCSDAVTWTNCFIGNSGNLSDDSCITQGHQYIQYQATLSTSDQYATPSLDSVSITYNPYANATLTSSAFDSTSPANVMGSISWNATNPNANTNVKFQMATSQNNSTWTDFLGPDGTNATYFTNFTGAESMPDVFHQGGDDRYFKYKTYLSTSDGSETPTLNSVTTNYVVNANPEFNTNFGTSGVSIKQLSTSDTTGSNLGKVQIDYQIMDPDASSGNNTQYYVTPSFYYSINGGTDWTLINSNITGGNVIYGDAPTDGDISERNADGKYENKVKEGNHDNYLQYTAYFDAKSVIPSTYLSQASGNFKIRVIVSDNEGANNTATAISSAIEFDTKNPTGGITVDATTIPATAHLTESDDGGTTNHLNMDVNLSNSFSSILTTPYNSSPTISLATDPDTVYVQLQDIYGNTSTVYQVTTPETPDKIMVQDTSNMKDQNNPEYRLFVAWKIIASPSPAGFKEYDIYRSENQSSLGTKIKTELDINTNYYGDNSTEYNKLYYYRVISEDNYGNRSYVSESISANANGVQDAGEGGGGTSQADIPPVISKISNPPINITTTTATVTWDTDILSDSAVIYSTTQGVFTNEIGVNTMLTNGHSVTLIGLTPDTDYYYEVRSINATNAAKTEDNNGNGFHFKTLSGDSTSPSLVGDIEATATATTATITWETNESSTSSVEFSTNNGFSNGTGATTYGASGTNHTVTLSSLKDNTTYYYKVHSKDPSNNEYISTQKSFQTLQSGDVTPPEISGIQVVPHPRYATFTWTTDEPANSYVEYGLTTAYEKGLYGNATFETTPHEVNLPGDLDYETTYHYKIHTSDEYGNKYVTDDATFTTLSNPNDTTSPNIDNVEVGTPSADSIVISWDDSNELATSIVEYSLDGGNNFLSQGSNKLTANHSVTLVGLNPGTLYVARVLSRDAENNLRTDDNGGIYYTFMTQAGPQAPVITSIDSIEVDRTEATISWTTDANSSSFVEYGLDTSYGTLVGKNNSTTSHSVTIKNLVSPATYHFRVRSRSITEAVSGDNTFSTDVDVTSALISSISAINIDSNSVDINWNTNEDANTILQWGTSTSYSNIDGNKDAEEQSHTVNLNNLEPNTTYHYQIVSTDTSNNVSYSADQNFTTLPDTTEPNISHIEKQIITKDSALLTWDTDKDTTTSMNWGTGHDLANSAATSLFGKTHFLKLSNLNSLTRYFFEIFAEDSYGNSNTSDEDNFTTLASAELDHEPISEITDIEVPEENLSDTNAVITFNTDQIALCSAGLEYVSSQGNTASLNFFESGYSSESNYNMSHAIRLTELNPQTEYTYIISCHDNFIRDENGEGTDRFVNWVFSNGDSFTTMEEQIPAGGGESGDTTAPSISNVKISALTGESATVTWDTDENANSLVRFGSTTDYGSMAGDDAVNLDEKNFAKSHTVIISGLIPATKYYFTASSYDSSGNIGESSQDSFTTASPSSLSSIKVESKNLGEATITWKTDKETTSIVEYGLKTDYGDKKENTSYTKEHTISLSKLDQGVTYHYRVKGMDKNKNLYASADNTFEPKSPPSIKAININNVTEHEATVTFTTNVSTDSNVTYTDTQNKNETGSQGSRELATDHKIILTNLSQGTTFSLDISVKDEQGTEATIKGPDFTTGKDENPPKIENVKTESALTQNDKVQTIISWKTDEQSNTTLVYREGRNGEEKEFKGTDNLTTGHIVVITSFKTGTVYTFKVRSTDASGNTGESGQYSLLTPKRKENIIQIITNNFQEIFGWVGRTR